VRSAFIGWSIYGVSQALALLRRTNENGEAGCPASPLYAVLTFYLQYPADWNPDTMAAQVASTPAALVRADWHAVASELESVVQQAAAAAHPVPVAVFVDVAVTVEVLGSPAQVPVVQVVVELLEPVGSQFESMVTG
jgi:hypothetical protein